MKNKYYDIRKLENKVINIINYKIIYTDPLNNEKETLSTINSWLAICQYIYLNSYHKCGYTVQIFKRGKDITEKVNKQIEKLNKMIEKL